MLLCGVDPGLDGAFAFYDTDMRRIVCSFPMPTYTLAKTKGSKRTVAWMTLAATIESSLGDHTVNYAFVEDVHAMPKQGVTSSFNFGRSFGGLESAVAFLGWPVEYVSAPVWKKVMRVPAAKDDAINRATQMMPLDAEKWRPQRGVITSEQAGGIAEAALLCRYGEQWLNRGVEPVTKVKRPRLRIGNTA